MRRRCDGQPTRIINYAITVKIRLHLVDYRPYLHVQQSPIGVIAKYRTIYFGYVMARDRCRHDDDASASRHRAIYKYHAYPVHTPTICHLRYTSPTIYRCNTCLYNFIRSPWRVSIFLSRLCYQSESPYCLHFSKVAFSSFHHLCKFLPPYLMWQLRIVCTSVYPDAVGWPKRL